MRQPMASYHYSSIAVNRGLPIRHRLRRMLGDVSFDVTTILVQLANISGGYLWLALTDKTFMSVFETCMLTAAFLDFDRASQILTVPSFDADANTDFSEGDHCSSSTVP